MGDRRRARLRPFVLAALAALVGCETAPVSIEAHLAPDPITCELSTDPAGPRIIEPTLDLVLGDRSSYVIAALVRNHTDEEITLLEAVLDMRWRVDGELVPFRVVCEGGEMCQEWTLSLCDAGCPTIPPGGAIALEVPTLPSVATRYFVGQMDAAVFEGRTPPEYETVPRVRLAGLAGARQIESAPFEIDLRVCLGCLVTFPEAADSPGIPGPDCCGRGLPESTCQPGQDDPIDCRACREIVPEVCNFGILTCG